MGALMSALRKSKGMTQQDVADKLGVSNKAVSKWERDDGYPDISILPAIAEIYGITVDELLRGEIRNEEKEVRPVSIEKSNKQRDFLLKSSLLKFKNMSIIAIVIAALSAVLCIAIEQSLYSISIDRYALAAGVSIIVASVSIVLEFFAKNKFLFTLTSAQDESPEEDFNNYFLSLRNYMTSVLSFSALGFILALAACIQTSAGIFTDISIFIISLLFALFITLIIFYYCDKAYNKNGDTEKRKIRTAFVKETAKKALIGTVIIAVTLFTAISVIEKANTTHKFKFENEEEMTAYMEFREEHKFPLVSKDDEKLSVTLIVLADGGFYFDDFDELFYDYSYSEESKIKTADEDITLIAMTYVMGSKEEYKTLTQNECVDYSFLKNSPQCLNIRGHRVSYNIQNCTVTYSDGNFSDIVPMVIIFDAAVCLVFIAVYSVVRYKKFKKEN